MSLLLTVLRCNILNIITLLYCNSDYESVGKGCTLSFIDLSIKVETEGTRKSIPGGERVSVLQ